MTQKFVKVPRMWQSCLQDIGADASTYRLALYLLDKAAFAEHVPLGNRTLAKHRLGRWAKRHALQQLRAAGLVAVEDRPGRPPLVKVRWQ